MKDIIDDVIEDQSEKEKLIRVKKSLNNFLGSKRR
jgi:hypothetical protein